MIQTPGHPSALAAVAPSSDYFASATHYESLARRIAAALSGDGRFVLVTDDPPANSRALSLALSNVVGPCQAVIGITCGPELRSDDLRRILARPRANGGAAGAPKYSLPTSSLFVFDDFGRLSDKQIEDVYERILHGDEMNAAGVLLARPDLLDRLEGSALSFLKEGLAAHFRVEEVGDDEVIPFLHNQLLAQRDRRSEARGFRRGIFMSLACGVVLAASTGAFLLLHKAERLSEESLSTGKSSLVRGEASVLQPAVDEMLQDSEIQRHPHASLDEGTVAGTPEIRLPEQTQVEEGAGFYGYVVRPRSNPPVRHAASRSSGAVKTHRDKTAAELNRAELSRLLRAGRALGRAPRR